MTKTIAGERASLAGLDRFQMAAVSDSAKQLLVVAGAGSGKTRVFVHRIARMIEDGAEPSGILALSYTNAAADEVKTRLSKMGINGVQAMTMHAWCNREPMKKFSHLIGKEGYSILDNEGSEDVLRYDLRLGEHGAANAKAELTAAKNLLDERYNARVVEEYDKILASRGKLDFDDLQVGALKLLQEHPEVLAHYRSRLEHVLIDEYQDVNPVQHEILSLLCSPGSSRNDAYPSLTVVGDPDQSIYQFRGSDPKFILGFQTEFPRASKKLLTRNYRSTERILQVADDIVGVNGDRIAKRMQSHAGKGKAVSLTPYYDEASEARAVAKEIADLLAKGIEANEVAVLYRYHKQAEPIKEALKQLGIKFYAPHDTEGDVKGVMGLGDRVVLRSIHSAKGLEYEAVLLPGWAEGALPTYRVRQDPSLINEECRVAYVALTRGKRHVSVSWPLSRDMNGRTVSQQASRFVEEMKRSRP